MDGSTFEDSKNGLRVGDIVLNLRQNQGARGSNGYYVVKDLSEDEESEVSNGD